jgi:multidrug efflux pump subunit AcrA (membrane-fusion protein)
MTRRRGRRSARSWYLYLFGVVAIAIIALGVSEVGAPTSSARTSKEVVTAQDGVVQSTVSGSGNVEPGVDDAVNFATSGTLQTINVTVGEHVKQGQLIATLDPTSAQLTLNEAQDGLTSAEDSLTAAEDGDSTSSGSGSSGSDASAASVGNGKGTGSKGADGTTSTKSGDSSSTTTTAAKPTPSPAEIAQAESSVDSAEANVTSAEKALADTELYAPVTGTVASLSSDEIGQTVSSGSSASTGSGTDAAASAGSGTGSAASSSASSSSGFATIINNKTMTMTVSLSESDISSVKVGQIATVSLSALTGVELGGKVTSISPLGSSSDGVVSYDVGLTIYQYNPKVLPGMSATATIVTGQAQGVTLPTDAVSGDTVDLDTNGKITTQSVTVGLKGTSREVIESGLKAGQEVQVTITLPALGTSTTSSSTSGLTSRFGGGGFGGGGGGFGGGGVARAFFGGGA